VFGGDDVAADEGWPPELAASLSARGGSPASFASLEGAGALDVFESVDPTRDMGSTALPCLLAGPRRELDAENAAYWL
jgi:hypothetical protein